MRYRQKRGLNAYQANNGDTTATEKQVACAGWLDLQLGKAATVPLMVDMVSSRQWGQQQSKAHNEQAPEAHNGRKIVL